jgi:hypothetical protein
VQGTTRLANTVTLGTLPTTSAGSYDFLTRNVSTGIVESIPSSSLTGFLTTTTSQSGLTGIKSWTNTGTTQINGLSLTNSATNAGVGSGVLTLTNTSTGNGSTYANQSTGTTLYINNNAGGYGLRVSNASTGKGITVENVSSGAGIVSNANSGATGFNFVGQDNSINTFTVNKDGLVSLGTFTVATLPTPSGTAYATVTDALTPAYLTIVVGGGAVVTPVFYNGTNWVAH